MQRISFADRVVIVTGAGGGLGSAYAREIARRGGAVVVNDPGGSVTGAGAERSAAFADKVVGGIRAEGGVAIANYDSVAAKEGAERMVAAALQNFGRVDAVIANAGNMRYGDFESLTLEDLNSLFSVHVGGAWNICQAAWPEMKKRGYGRVVFACSSAGMFGNEMLTAYGAAKGGMMGLMHGLALAGRSRGILCNAVMPNAMSRMTSGMKPEELGENPYAAALGKFFDPEYTSGLVAFLASDACKTDHGLYSALGGRIGRCFIGVANGVAGDAVMDADEVAAHWARINDDTAGYGIPGDVHDEYRIVAAQRGVKV